MTEKQLERRAYVKPAMSVCELQTENLLQRASGQHEDAENGGTSGDAKRGWFDEEEEDEKENNPWGI